MKTNLKISLIASLFFPHFVFANNPFEVYFDSTTPYMQDKETIIFDGMRVEGAGFSATNDALKVKFHFDHNSLNFLLNREDIDIYSNVGVFHEEHMAIDTAIAQPTYTVNNSTYNFGDTYNFETSLTSPYIAEMNLKTGHVISWLIDNQTNGYTWELIGNNVESYFIGKANEGVISFSHKILTEGIYKLKIIPDNAFFGNFKLTIYNANHRNLVEITQSENISVFFKENLRDYAKFRLKLHKGERLSLSAPSSSDIQFKLVNSLGKAVKEVRGLPLIYDPETTDYYFLFIDNSKGWGGSYQGTVSISPVPFSRSHDKRPNRIYEKVGPAKP